MKVYAFDPEMKQAWEIRPGLGWFKKHDNGRAFSIGFQLGVDITERQLNSLLSRGGKKVSWEEYNHSGCQTSCILRGNDKCSW